jgi:hypothetical protein
LRHRCAALGIGTGAAWIETFKTSNFEGYSGMLVFFTFIPPGAAHGTARHVDGPSHPHSCNAKLLDCIPAIGFYLTLILKRSIRERRHL